MSTCVGRLTAVVVAAIGHEAIADRIVSYAIATDIFLCKCTTSPITIAFAHDCGRWECRERTDRVVAISPDSRRDVSLSILTSEHEQLPLRFYDRVFCVHLLKWTKLPTTVHAGLFLDHKALTICYDGRALLATLRTHLTSLDPHKYHFLFRMRDAA